MLGGPEGVVWDYGVLGPLLWAIVSLYNQCKSLVGIPHGKLDSFLVGAGLRERCPLSWILLVKFIYQIKVKGQRGFSLVTSGS